MATQRFKFDNPGIVMYARTYYVTFIQSQKQFVNNNSHLSRYGIVLYKST